MGSGYGVSVALEPARRVGAMLVVVVVPADSGPDDGVIDPDRSGVGQVTGPRGGLKCSPGRYVHPFSLKCWDDCRSLSKLRLPAMQFTSLPVPCATVRDSFHHRGKCWDE